MTSTACHAGTRAPLRPRFIEGHDTPAATSRWTLSGAFLGMAISAGLFSLLFSAYWLILAAAALLGFTQSWSFDLARIEQRVRRTAPQRG